MSCSDKVPGSTLDAGPDKQRDGVFGTAREDGPA